MLQFLKFILELKLYMFRTIPLSIIRSYSLYIQQWFMSYRSADSFRAAGSGWNRITLLNVQWITPDDGQRNCPKHVEFQLQNKLEKLVYLGGFIIRKSGYLRYFIQTSQRFIQISAVKSCSLSQSEQ
jgi:hypothetical protein